MRIFLLACCWAAVCQLPAQTRVPKVWDEEKLRDWATPVAGLNLRPSHISEREYYAAPVSHYRTYPVYYPGREPEGYWERLQTLEPQPLIEPKKLRTEADWVAAGKRVFFEGDVPAMRRFDPELIAKLRSPKAHEEAKTVKLKSGLIHGIRWIVTEKGVGVTADACAVCHTRLMENGEEVPGPGANLPGTDLAAPVFHVAGAAFPLEGDEYAVAFWRNYSVPWLADDIHAGLQKMALPELFRLFGSAAGDFMFPRWGGSPYFPTKIPDLIGIRDRRYIDHTGTHLHRDIGDLMRYAAHVTWAESVEYGPHKILSGNQPRVWPRWPDEALYALAKYIYSLEPPSNPHPFDAHAKAGQQVFQRAGCPVCHTPPLYTNNKLTLARGFRPPPDRPATLDIMPVSVGTDPGLALRTRKGTGYYKVPSLKGVWYRGRYLHDGSVASLEELFNPNRVQDTHVPGGWKPLDAKTWAIKGHEYGLDLTPAERAQLIAFLRTL